MKHQCPNCKKFTYEKEMSNRGCGFYLLFGVPLLSLLVPGASSFYGGDISFEEMFPFMVVSMIVGIIVVLFTFIFPQKTIDYKCSNCEFTQKHEL